MQTVRGDEKWGRRESKYGAFQGPEPCPVQCVEVKVTGPFLPAHVLNSAEPPVLLSVA